jgi:benzoate/toluate 1,2-dioxygenase reductase component
MNPYFTKAKVTDKEIITSKETKQPTLTVVTIKLIQPDIKPFRPGQFCSIRVAEGFFRAYSIASDYKNFSEYKFLVSTGHEGVGSAYFRNLNIGDEVNFLGPNGHFFIKTPVAENIIFCATGTGIAPFIPMIEFLVDNKCDSKIAFIHGIKHEDNFEFYQNIHHELKKKCSNFMSKFYVSKPKTISDDFSVGRITDEIKKLDLTKHVDTQFYLCGHPNMVQEITTYLLEKGISEENIISEEFTSPGFYQKED